MYIAGDINSGLVGNTFVHQCQSSYLSSLFERNSNEKLNCFFHSSISTCNINYYGSLHTFFVFSLKYFSMILNASLALLLTCSPGIDRLSIGVLTNCKMPS